MAYVFGLDLIEYKKNKAVLSESFCAALFLTTAKGSGYTFYGSGFSVSKSLMSWRRRMWIFNFKSTDKLNVNLRDHAGLTRFTNLPP